MDLEEIGCMVWLHLADSETFLKITEYQPKGRCSRTVLKMERLFSNDHNNPKGKEDNDNDQWPAKMTAKYVDRPQYEWTNLM
jgi:hypothetical protein